VFALLGFPGDVARLTGISHHLITQVYGYALGAAALALLLLPWLRVRSEMSRPPSDGGRPAAFYARLALTTLGLLAGVAASFAAVQSCAGGAGRQGPRAVAPELPAGGAGPRGVAGRVLFDSDRGGTFGLYTMKPDGTDARCLLDGPMAEIYPDPSPDGRWIAFAKATSAGKGAVSEVWICRSDGSGARRLSGDGTFPTFSGDGKTVYFERDRKKVMAVGVDGGGEREIFPAGRPAFARYAVVKPRVSPDGRWVAAISDRGGRWNTWAAELASGRETHVGAGCEPAWFPDSRRVAWVRKQGVRQGSGLFVKDVLTGATEELQDAGPPLGHEYFPTVSRDGRFLLWSACPEGQHGHEGSDYQVFIRDLAGGGAVRLTYDAANNRWPKILPDAAR
jgi:Tol biopolymer transport system component